MSCSTNRCFMLNGGSGNQARVLPQAENTPYPEGAGSASEAARMNGNVNINNQLEMSKAFKGGSGGRIVVAQPAEVSQSQSGSQSANHTSQSLAVSLTQGNENASMDSQVGAGRRRRMRKSKRNKNVLLLTEINTCAGIRQRQALLARLCLAKPSNVKQHHFYVRSL